MGSDLWPCPERSTKRTSTGEKVGDGIPGKGTMCTKAQIVKGPDVWEILKSTFVLKPGQQMGADEESGGRWSCVGRPTGDCGRASCGLF